MQRETTLIARDAHDSDYSESNGFGRFDEYSSLAAYASCTSSPLEGRNGVMCGSSSLSRCSSTYSSIRSRDTFEHASIAESIEAASAISSGVLRDIACATGTSASLRSEASLQNTRPRRSSKSSAL